MYSILFFKYLLLFNTKNWHGSYAKLVGKLLVNVNNVKGAIRKVFFFYLLFFVHLNLVFIRLHCSLSLYFNFHDKCAFILADARYTFLFKEYSKMQVDMIDSYYWRAI